MDESDQHELLNLDFSITEVRKDYVRSRDHLRRIMDAHATREDADRLLLDAAEEYGVEEAMGRFSDRPDTFGCVTDKLTANEIVILAQTLEALVAADFDLTRFVAFRENILCAEDPDRQRRYNVDGREAVLDLDGKVVRFEEDKSEAPLLVEGIEPQQTIDQERFTAEREVFEASSKDRPRDRDR